MPEYFSKTYSAEPDPKFLHKARHTALREALDELMWDFRANNGHMSSQTSVTELYAWAVLQERDPADIGNHPDGHERAEVKFRGTWRQPNATPPVNPPDLFSDNGA